MTQQQLLARLQAEEIAFLWVIYHDYNGRSCAKVVPRERFAEALERGIVFAQANVDFDLQDHQAPGGRFLAETGDFLAVPDAASYAPVPYRRATGRAHAFMRLGDGAPWEGCPRARLQQITEAYRAQGLSVRVAFEAEFTLFQRVSDGEYRPANQDGMFTVTGLDRHYALWQQVMEALEKMGTPVEQLGKEYGPGQYEGTTRHALPLKALDDYLTLKEVVRALSRDAGLIASFMPKPYQHCAGCGLHLHMSLWDAEGRRELSPGEKEDELLSPLGRQFVAGLLAHAPALCGVGSPIVNSYKRLLPGSWAPAHVCWGVGNRAALVRVPGGGRRRRVELRSGDNACNPFLFLTAVLAAGLDGMRNRLEPAAPVADDVGHLTEAEARARGLALLPRSLPEALAALEADAVIAEALGPVILPEFLKVKRSELAACERHVHPWERSLYLEAL